MALFWQQGTTPSAAQRCSWSCPWMTLSRTRAMRVRRALCWERCAEMRPGTRVGHLCCTPLPAIPAGEPAAAQAAAGAVCKMAALFTALLPAPPAADAPALALQRHNDATYIADHLLLLPYLFGAELEGLLGGPLWLGDDALRLRGAARAALADAVRRA
jgi:hypothetical protein